jgi:hypothetical protein
MKTGEFFDPRIKIRAPLRCDGIGRLDCAEDVESGARLAVRWLPLEANGDAAVRACARLPEHPALPLIRQTGHMGDKAYVAMEFPDGRMLGTMLGEPVSGELLLEIGAQLADALATIHMQKVFHGELSPESVLLAKGKAYLWDMPLVIANRLTDRRGEERLMHMLVRTAHYLPPERACGTGASAEGDVYSLAAVMCIAGGARLPQTQTTLSIVHKIANNEWAPEVPAVFRDPYRKLLLRMLDTEPAERPTAREVADMLAKPVAGIPTLPEMPAIVFPQQPAKPSQHAGAHPLKMSRPSPFTSAPGALEPMLPSRGVADAAVKADASRPMPLAAALVKPEPTVRMIVPPMVLEAMSLGQDIVLEPALKAMSAAAAASAAAQTTTDPEIKIPTEIATAPNQPDPLSALLSTLAKAPAAAEETPVVPMTALQAATLPALPDFTTPADPVKKASTSGPRAKADVETALEAKASSGPRAKAEVQQALDKPRSEPKVAVVPAPVATPDKAKSEPKVAVVPAPLPAPAAEPMQVSDADILPTASTSQPQLPIPPAPEPLPAPRRASLDQVPMTENVSVAQDLAAAGAELLSDEAADALTVLPRTKPTWLMAAAGLALMTTLFGVGARAVGSHKAPAPLVVPAPTVMQPVKMELTPVVKPSESEDDELMPLPTRPRAVIRRPRPAVAVPHPAYVEPQTDEPSAAGGDFALPADPQDDGLKRPSL